MPDDLHADPALAAADVVATLAGFVEDVFAAVAGLRRTAEAVLGARAPVTQRDLAPLEAPARGALEQVGGTVVGAGFVAAAGTLADTAYWLEWWTVDEQRHRAMRLTVETDAAADGFRDYTVLPWYAAPARTGRRAVTGPYVDYLCTDQYTLTFTEPVLREGVFAGVVGCDVHARSMERLLLPLLRALPAPACVVNVQGRVVAGNRPDLVTGVLLREVPVSALWQSGASVRHGDDVLVCCPGAPLALLVRG